MSEPLWPIQVRCPNCNHRHFDATGFGSIIIVKCRCGVTFRWPSLAPEIVPSATATVVVTAAVFVPLHWLR